MLDDTTYRAFVGDLENDQLVLVSELHLLSCLCCVIFKKTYIARILFKERLRLGEENSELVPEGLPLQFFLIMHLYVLSCLHLFN